MYLNPFKECIQKYCMKKYHVTAEEFNKIYLATILCQKTNNPEVENVIRFIIICISNINYSSDLFIKIPSGIDQELINLVKSILFNYQIITIGNKDEMYIDKDAYRLKNDK